jgi:hypothetical protein
MPGQPPADSVYGAQLAKLKHGYPLWIPEPTIPGRPVTIGDVGYVERGAFYPLFNICRPAAEQIPLGVPEGFELFSLEEHERCIMADFFEPQPLFTASVNRVDVSIEATA